MVNIQGLDKAEVLAALYNRAQPQGMGFLHYIEGDMPTAEARDMLSQYGPHPYFDYVKGRVMKVDLRSDVEFDPRLYDRDNGEGAAQGAIARLRERVAQAA